MASPKNNKERTKPRRARSVSDQLRIHILSGNFEPGQFLNEARLAQKYKISRIPIREALIKLQGQGLVTTSEGYRRCHVIQLSPDDIQSINNVRLVLEAEAVWLARKNMNKNLKTELQKIIKRMASPSNNLFDSPVLDLEFHSTVWRASGNTFLVAALTPLVSRLFAFRAITHRISADSSSKEERRKMQAARVAHHCDLLSVLLGESDVHPIEAVHTHIASAFHPPKLFGSLQLRQNPKNVQ